MITANDSVGVGSAASTPFQQLGAAPGSAAALLGYEGNDPEDDGMELPPSYVATRADITAREATNVLLVGYETEGIDREFAGGSGVGLGREEAV